MAQAREGADEILAVQPAGVDQPAETGGHGEAAVAYRARLRGTEAGAWTGALRRTQLARLSPPCQLLHRCLRLPGGGTMPFFPHARLPNAACRQPPTSPTPIATRGETSWRCRLERNGIIRIPSPPCAARSPPTWRAPCPDVPAACASSYNTVVLASLRGVLETGKHSLARDETVLSPSSRATGSWNRLPDMIKVDDRR